MHTCAQTAHIVQHSFMQTHPDAPDPVAVVKVCTFRVNQHLHTPVVEARACSCDIGWGCVLANGVKQVLGLSAQEIAQPGRD